MNFRQAHNVLRQFGIKSHKGMFTNGKGLNLTFDLGQVKPNAFKTVAPYLANCYREKLNMATEYILRKNINQSPEG